VSTHPGVPPQRENQESETAESATHPIKLMHPVVVRFRPNVSEARKRELRTKHHLVVPEGDAVFVNGNAREAARQIEALRAEDDITSVVSPEAETRESATHRVRRDSETHPIVPRFRSSETHPVVLRFRPNVSEARKRELRAKHQLAVPEGELLFFNGDAREAARQIEALRAEDDIATVDLGG
jgi:hypothetical protein